MPLTSISSWAVSVCTSRSISLQTEMTHLQTLSNARKELKDRLESISHMYSCGDLIFKDDEASGKVITQRLNLSCESPIEKCYYNTEGRAFQTPDICIHCGAGGSSDFIFGQKHWRIEIKLEEESATQSTKFASMQEKIL